MAEARSGSGERDARGAGASRSSGTSGARRSTSRSASSARSGGSSSRSSASSARSAPGPAEDQGFPRPGAAGGGHVCPVAFCPVGMALTFAEAARPEVVQHLMAAGQELMLAVKAMIDARAEAVARTPGFEHIRIR